VELLMAHELFIDNGRAAMFYVDAPAWHGLGTKLDAPPTSREAIRAAGLEWTVVKAPLYIAGGTRLHEVPRLHEIPGRFALVRRDKLGEPDCHVFGIAGREYVPLQNDEAFEFFDPLVSDGHATYETAGALRRGERIWIQARLRGDDLEIVSGDRIQRFLLLSNSHNGTSSVQVKLTPVRVVCQNTLSAALAKGPTIQVRHDQDMQARLKHAKELLGVVRTQYDDLAAVFRRMAALPLDRQRAAEYFSVVFPDGGSPETKRRSEQDRKRAFHFYNEGRGNDEARVRGTLWAAYNGVTELVDHRRSRFRPDASSARLASVWFGAGAAIKQRAFELASDWVAPS
jgi:phage/plasmid-like protein (TIGR03299 family)